MIDRRRAVLVMPDAEVESSLADAERAREDHEIVAVLGSGAGWYAALASAGVLSDEAAVRIGRWLVTWSAEAEPAATRVIYPLADAAWQPDPRLHADLAAAIAAGQGAVQLSVDLGSYAVIAGSQAGVEALMAALPAVGTGDRRYPLQLPSRSPLHTPMAAFLADRLRDEADGTGWQMPQVTLIDGRGVRHTPWSADPAALRDYTLGARLTQTDLVATAIRVALREYAPDVIVVPRHGGILGTICAQLIVAEGYRGIRSRRTFIEAQRRRPIVLSMRH